MPNKKSTSVFTSFHLLCFVVLLAVILLLLKYCIHQRRMATPGSMPKPVAYQQQQMSFDFTKQEFTLDGTEITGSITNRNVSPDGTTAAAILVNSSQGSGTFYYLVGAMMKDGKEVYSTPVLLGDRVKIVYVTPDNPGTEDNGLITVQYLDRAKNAPMVTEPTIKMVKKFAFEDNGNLIGVLH